jgi:hypothetical protein
MFRAVQNHANARKEFEDQQNVFALGFYKCILGVRPSTPSWVVLRELGELPIHLQVILRAVNFFNQCMMMPSSSLARQALQADLALHADEVSREDSWSYALFQALDKMQCRFMVQQPTGAWPTGVWLFHDARIKWALVDACYQVFARLPYPGPEFPEEEGGPSLKLAMYHHVFAEPGWDMPAYLRQPLPFRLVSRMARFRMGSHFLGIETGRWANPKLPRASRVCSVQGCPGCGTVVDDECHAVFSCSAYGAARVRWLGDIMPTSSGFQGLSELFFAVSDKARFRCLAEFLFSARCC